MDSNDNDTIPATEVAEILGYHYATVRALALSGEIEPVGPRGRGHRLQFDRGAILDYRDRIHGTGDWLHTEAVAEYAMCALSTVVEAIGRGELPATKTGKRWAVRKRDGRRWAHERDPDLLDKAKKRIAERDQAVAVQKLLSGHREDELLDILADMRRSHRVVASLLEQALGLHLPGVGDDPRSIFERDFDRRLAAGHTWDSQGQYFAAATEEE
jgi:excisionase family DNA binding protein